MRRAPVRREPVPSCGTPSFGAHAVAPHLSLTPFLLLTRCGTVRTFGIVNRARSDRACWLVSLTFSRQLPDSPMSNAQTTVLDSSSPRDRTRAAPTMAAALAAVLCRPRSPANAGPAQPDDSGGDIVDRHVRVADRRRRLVRPVVAGRHRAGRRRDQRAPAACSAGASSGCSSRTTRASPRKPRTPSPS